jgi:hypothetical protein
MFQVLWRELLQWPGCLDLPQQGLENNEVNEIEVGPLNLGCSVEQVLGSRGVTRP